jgi:uncharacterized membrane protein
MINERDRELAIELLEVCDGMDTYQVCVALALALGSAVAAHTTNLEQSLKAFSEIVEAAARAHPKQAQRQ